MALPYPNPSWIYEGTNEGNFEEATGIVTNRAPKQLLMNDVDLDARLTALAQTVANLVAGGGAGGAGLPINSEIMEYDAAYAYGKYSLCSNQDANNPDSRIVYISKVDNNTGNALPTGNSNNYWEVVQLNIFKDLITSISAGWSSSKITSYVTNAINNIPGITVIDGGNATT